MRPLLLLALALAIETSGGCGASQRTTTLKTALITVDTARDAFLAFDVAAQANLISGDQTAEAAIVSGATSAADGQTKLAAYRAARATKLAAYHADRDKIATAFNSAYHAIAAAATVNDDASITGMQAALAQLTAAITPYLGGSK